MIHLRIIYIFSFCDFLCEKVRVPALPIRRIWVRLPRFAVPFPWQVVSSRAPPALIRTRKLPRSWCLWWSALIRRHKLPRWRSLSVLFVWSVTIRRRNHPRRQCPPGRTIRWTRSRHFHQVFNTNVLFEMMLVILIRHLFSNYLRFRARASRSSILR